MSLGEYAPLSERKRPCVPRPALFALFGALLWAVVGLTATLANMGQLEGSRLRVRLTVGGTEVGHTRQTAELLQPVWGDRFAYGRPITALAAREVEIKLELIHDSHSTDLRAGDAQAVAGDAAPALAGALRDLEHGLAAVRSCACS